jgi:hypothetical protein
MLRRFAALFAVTLLSFTLTAHIALAPTDTAPASPIGAVQEFVAGLVKSTEAIIASIESVIGNLAAAITGQVAVASNAASAAEAIAPNTPTENTLEAPTAPIPPPPSSPSIPDTTATPTPSGAVPSLPAAPSTGGASDDNVFELQSVVAGLADGVSDLTTLFATQPSSSKIESQIAALQSAISAQRSGHSYNAFNRQRRGCPLGA